VLEKEGLHNWIWKCGLDGLDYKKVRDEAGEAGTLAHYMILCHLRGDKPDFGDYAPNIVALAENSFLSYLEWEGKHKLESIKVEEPMVDDGCGFGGTIDWYGRLDGKLTLVDFKSGKAIYDEHLIQVAVYRHLLDYHHFIIDDVRILRIGRGEDDKYDERILTPQEGRLCWDIFEAAHIIYETQKELKKAK